MRLRWRHLGLGATRLFLEAEIRQLACRRCQPVRTEAAPWARPDARFTRDFEDVVAYLAQRTDKTTITGCCAAPGRPWPIVVRVVAADLDQARLDDLYQVGIDEVSYRNGHRYLTVVADHDRHGAVVWVGEGKSGATFERFFDQLGAERTSRLRAVSVDLHGAYARGAGARAPQARVCADPFHVVKLANHAIDEVPRTEWNATQQQTLDRLRRARHVLVRAWALKEELRDLYRLPVGRHAGAHLDAWLARACRCPILAMVALSKIIQRVLSPLRSTREEPVPVHSAVDPAQLRVLVGIRCGVGRRAPWPR
jgi:transposase